MTDSITTRMIGAPNTLNYSLYYEKEGHLISPFHDIPLFANQEKDIFNMIVEIPRWTNAKNEINKETPLNPIRQDIEDNKPRFVPSVFPLHGYIWNYGAFPQTWENPAFISPHTNKGGDNDPIDVIELGRRVATTGEIKQVKILGILGLLDQEETDWKVVVIDIRDPLADQLEDIDDVDKFMPGYLQQTNHYFKTYKLPSGGKENDIAFDGKAQNKSFATDIVFGTHEEWKLLVNGTTPRKHIQTINLTVKDSPYRVDPDHDIVTGVPKANPLPAAPIPEQVNTWHFY
ncbi:inorganic pyrophosphatase [Gilbertella persicaria]|uniref:Inorganic pyrophosphatase n=1 Tax=Rhizopus stolonifer TaxID=4846 RepID=A0A367KG25_RHIST|nr:inorganic pyrophosphatase [Gilbertella persicaria]KAI8094848.1 inorganic pyrophosphatase [Gilbertella persicaria]RCI01091.1 Inorganic pyrophosphatase [Rhizopus stolonifer]